VGILVRAMNSLQVGYNAALQAWQDPSSVVSDYTRRSRQEEFAIAWLYYRDQMFAAGQNWDTYLSARDLYKHTRLIFNPVPSVVGFYEDHVFSSPDNSRALEDGTQLVTNVFDSTPEDLQAAIAQLDQWGNWQSEAYRAVRYCAVTGSVLIELQDDLVREKILHQIRWPGQVQNLMLDSQGNVKAYAVEFQVQEGVNRYRYRKEIDQDEFRYFRDDAPYIPEGRDAAVEANPYGFVPAVWIKHIDDGSDLGNPAFSKLDKLNELNSIVSHAHDHIHRQIESPKVLSTDGEIKSVTGAVGNVSATGTGSISPYDTRRDWMLLKAPSGASVLDLAGILKLAEADPYIDRTLSSFSSDYPELQAHEIIKANSQLSGAALERMLAPSQAKLDRACAQYFQQIIKLRQMGIAIAGWRQNGGGWLNNTIQQQRFKPFNLDSYEKGDLNFGIKRSLLIENTESEVEDLLTKKAARATELEPMVGEEEALRIAGYSQDEIVTIMETKRTTGVLPTVAQ
jgi:hypothetical protein